jgi:CheY-like chemotaxis protein
MSSNSPVVLLVDDDEMCRVVIQAYLEAHGLTVITVTSARAAFGVLQSTPVNAVVSDFEMPEMNGLELAAVVEGSYPNLPFFIMSGRDFPSGVDHHLRLAGWIRKGSPAMLLEELLHHLAKRTATPD